MLLEGFQTQLAVAASAGFPVDCGSRAQAVENAAESFARDSEKLPLGALSRERRQRVWRAPPDVTWPSPPSFHPWRPATGVTCLSRTATPRPRLPGPQPAMVPGSHAGPPPPMAHTAAPALATQPAPAAPGGVPVLESSAVAVPKQTTKESPYGERSTASLLQGITGVVAVGDQPPAPSSLGAQPPQPAAAPALHALALPATPPGLPAAPTGPHTSWTRAGGPPVGQLASVPELSMLSMPRPGSTVMLAGAPVLNARLPRMAQQHEAAAQHRQQMLMLLQQQQLAQTAAGGQGANTTGVVHKAMPRSPHSPAFVAVLQAWHPA